jgi:hypothetical protein
MGRTAIAWGSASAQELAAYSQPELVFATHFNMYPEVQLPSPNGSLGNTRGQVNCAMARSKALINAEMPVYFVWNRKSHISNGTAKSVGSHIVSNTRCHGISVDDCVKTENLYTPYEALRGPPGPRTASYAVFRVLCRSQSVLKMPTKVAAGAGALIFICRPSYSLLDTL